VTGSGRALAALALVVLGSGPTAVAADPAGDATRGRAVFEAKGCDRCHVSREQGARMGPPLEVLRRSQGLLELAGRLWNHAPSMLAALGQAGLAWPHLSAAEMGDLAAYLVADAARDPRADPFQGQVVLIRKACLKCHRLQGEGAAVATELTRYPGGYRSAVEWVTTVWSHSPRMAADAARLGVLYPRFSGDEMAHLVEFLRAATAGAPR
jgi:cytochrome c2